MSVAHPRVSHLSDPRQVSSAVNHTLKKTDPLSLSTDQLTLQIDRAVAVTGNASLTGNLTGVGATLSGNLVAVAGTFSGDIAAVNADMSGVYKKGGTQVLSGRITGWTADTGTAEKGAHATYTAGTTLTFTDPPTAAEMAALATRLAAIETALQGDTRGQKAIKDGLLTHGLIGT